MLSRITHKIFIFLLIASTTNIGYSSNTYLQIQKDESETVSLNSILNSGRYTLVMVWSLDCISCEEQKPMISRFHSQFENNTVSVIALATDGWQYRHAINEQFSQYDVNYKNYILSDDFKQQFISETGEQFFGSPTYLAYGPNKEFLGSHVGPISRSTLINTFNPEEYQRHGIANDPSR